MPASRHRARLVHQHVGAGRVDEVDAAADEQQVADARPLGARGLELVAHVLDGAEEQRPVDAQHVELRAQRRAVRDRDEASLGRVRRREARA